VGIVWSVGKMLAMTNIMRCSAAGVVLAGVLFLAGCSSNTSTSSTAAPAPRPAGTKLKVTATIAMIGDVAQRIGGDKAEVSILMGPGTDPHLYKAREEDYRQLDAADVVLYNGLNLEGKMGDQLLKLAKKKAAAKKGSVVAVTESIDEKLFREPEEMDGHFDPHLWFDVSLWMKAAEKIRDTLVEADAANAGTYKANAEKLLKEMSELHEWCKKEIASIPKEQRVLITAHDAFGYFGRAYDIEVHGIQGISTEDQASMAGIKNLVDLLVKRKVKAVFVESSVPKKNIEALVEGCKAAGHNVTVGGELFSDAMGDAGTKEGTYLGMVRHNVETIVKALK